MKPKSYRDTLFDIAVKLILVAAFVVFIIYTAAQAVAYLIRLTRFFN